MKKPFPRMTLFIAILVGGAIIGRAVPAIPSAVVFALVFFGSAMAIFAERGRGALSPILEPKRRAAELPPAGSGANRPAQGHTKLSLIEAIGLEVLAGEDLKVVAERTIDYLSRSLKAQTFLFLEHRFGKLSVIAARGPSADLLLGKEYQADDSVFAATASTLNIPDIAVDFKWGLKDRLVAELAQTGAGSFLITAIGQVGLLALADPRRGAFTKLDEAGVEAVALQLRYIAENIRSRSAMRQGVDQANAVLELVGGVGGAEDFSEALDLSLKSAIEFTGATNGFFLLFDEERQRLVVQASAGCEQSPIGSEVALGEGIAGWVACHRKPVIVKDLDLAGKSAGDQSGAALALPVTLGDNLIGVLNLGSAKPEHDFSRLDLSRVVGCFEQIGLAVGVSRTREDWKTLYLDTVNALAKVIESRVPYSEGHLSEVSRWAVALAAELKLAASEIGTIELAGILHDIGTIGISEDLFSSGGPLTTVERLMIRNHPRLGAKALSDVDNLRQVLPIIRHHHEHYDGSGYIDGLKAEEIPLGARIIAVAEAYAAMTAKRPFRPAKSQAEAVEELARCAGSQFDPEIVEAFRRLLDGWVEEKTNPAPTKSKRIKKAKL
jgi:HD-GYP domain-containing protein (c-di-GMP phosphodiesterase class II)